VRDSIRALLAPIEFLPSVPCIPCSLTFAALMAGYLIWLSGSIINSWRLPVWTDLVPWGAVSLTLFAGPLRPRHPEGVALSVAPERAVYDAMFQLRTALSRGDVACADAAAQRHLLADRRRFPLPGYRSHGSLVDYDVAVLKGTNGPMLDVTPGARPPMFQVVCNGKEFWISGVVLDLRTKSAMMLQQPVGPLAVVSGSTP
jgi:hypothetical protein